MNRILLMTLSVLALASCQTSTPTGTAADTNAAMSAADKSPGSPAVTMSAAHPSTAATAHQPSSTVAAERPDPNDLWELIRNQFALAAHYDHERVRQSLASYASDPALVSLINERAPLYLPTISRQVLERGLPGELALLPVVESTLDPLARSSESALGLWQFMPATADGLGLQRDWWFDGRQDPALATSAALDYLETLHSRFDGNWLLALAAYNTGEVNVRRALRRAGISAADPGAFWQLRLNSETMRHIPRLLSLAILVEQNDQQADELALNFVSLQQNLVDIELPAQIELALAAEWAGITPDELRAINPGFLRWATHPDGPQTIRLPHSAAQRFQQQLEQSNPATWVSWNHYEIQPGDSLGALARRFSLSVELLQRVNGLRGSLIIAGESLLIPRLGEQAGGLQLADLNQAPVPRTASVQATAAIPDTYRVRRGDNLWRIARRFNLRSEEIARHNGIELASLLKPGQVLDLRYASELQSD